MLLHLCVDESHLELDIDEQIKNSEIKSLHWIATSNSVIIIK